MFFKTDNKEIVAAYAKYQSDRSALHEAAKAFAKEYNAKPIVIGCRDGANFAGIVFDRATSLNTEVWRKPNRQYFNISNLRVKPTKKIYQAEYDFEKKKYDDLITKHFPNGEKVDFNLFLKTLGLGGGDLFFAGFHCFPLDGFLYIDTTIGKLAGTLTEILGSEHQAAHVKFNQKEKSDA